MCLAYTHIQTALPGVLDAGYDFLRVFLRLGLANWLDNHAHHPCSISFLWECMTSTSLVRVMVVSMWPTSEDAFPKRGMGEGRARLCCFLSFAAMALPSCLSRSIHKAPN